MKKAHERDAEATRGRLLDAAMEEFSRFGIAGARVDRIAASARSNKAQIYHYFGSKDELFDAVFGRLVEMVVSEIPLDAEDLPGYATMLFDGFDSRPDIARLATWYRLERGGKGGIIPAIEESHRKKVEAIAKAQKEGKVSGRFAPEVLLGLVMHTAALWADLSPEYDRVAASMSAEDRRDVVVSAVRLFV